MDIVFWKCRRFPVRPFQPLLSIRATRYAVLGGLCIFAWVCSTLPSIVHAQTDEIQVYDAEINAPGKFSVVLHNNYTPIGRKQPDFTNGIVPNHTLNGVVEWAYGVVNWLELGLYLPLYSVEDGRRWMLDGGKLRVLLVVPHARDLQFFYGVNFELSYNSPHWDPTRITGEIRPIIGTRIGRVDIVFNPIIDTSFNGFDQLSFAPAIRLAYNFSPTWAVALEHYSDFGPFSHFYAGSGQQQTLFAVVDYNGEKNGVEFGVGHGFTPASDDLVIKLMLIHNF